MASPASQAWHFGNIGTPYTHYTNSNGEEQALPKNIRECCLEAFTSFTRARNEDNLQYLLNQEERPYVLNKNRLSRQGLTVILPEGFSLEGGEGIVDSASLLGSLFLQDHLFLKGRFEREVEVDLSKRQICVFVHVPEEIKLFDQYSSCFTKRDGLEKKVS